MYERRSSREKSLSQEKSISQGNNLSQREVYHRTEKSKGENLQRNHSIANQKMYDITIRNKTRQAGEG
jgi:NADH:ubiquinone oxidoreductase subunit D